MAFTTFPSIDFLVKQYNLNYIRQDFIIPLALQVSSDFIEEININIKWGMTDSSENSICESLIFPILREVWKNYSQKFILWSHHQLHYTNDLTGIPDYVISVRPNRGPIFEPPFIIVIEAKKDDFESGWIQCLAAMITAQKLNKNEMAIHGIVSNGKNWEFGLLNQDSFIKNLTFYTIRNIPELFSIINYIFHFYTQTTEGSK